MHIRRLNINSSLDSIIQNDPDGDLKDFLITPQGKKEIEHLSFIGDSLQQEGLHPFIRVQFAWEFGQRPRRIDLVSFDDGQISIYKKSSVSSVDAHALDLWRLKSKIEERYNGLSVSCVLVFTEEIDEESVASIINSLGIDVQIKTIQ